MDRVDVEDERTFEFGCGRVALVLKRAEERGHEQHRAKGRYDWSADLKLSQGVVSVGTHRVTLQHPFLQGISGGSGVLHWLRHVAQRTDALLDALLNETEHDRRHHQRAYFVALDLHRLIERVGQAFKDEIAIENPPI